MLNSSFFVDHMTNFELKKILAAPPGEQAALLFFLLDEARVIFDAQHQDDKATYTQDTGAVILAQLVNEKFALQECTWSELQRVEKLINELEVGPGNPFSGHFLLHKQKPLKKDILSNDFHVYWDDAHKMHFMIKNKFGKIETIDVMEPRFNGVEHFVKTGPDDSVLFKNASQDMWDILFKVARQKNYHLVAREENKIAQLQVPFLTAIAEAKEQKVQLLQEKYSHLLEVVDDHSNVPAVARFGHMLRKVNPAAPQEMEDVLSNVEIYYPQLDECDTPHQCQALIQKRDAQSAVFLTLLSNLFKQPELQNKPGVAKLKTIFEQEDKTDTEKLYEFQRSFHSAKDELKTTSWGRKIIIAVLLLFNCQAQAFSLQPLRYRTHLQMEKLAKLSELCEGLKAHCEANDIDRFVDAIEEAFMAEDPLAFDMQFQQINRDLVAFAAEHTDDDALQQHLKIMINALSFKTNNDEPQDTFSLTFNFRG